MEKVADEIRTLRRTMRDLVALSALPAVWVRYQPREVAEGLADALLSTLRLELVYLRLPGQTNVQEIEVARTAGGSAPSDQTRDIGRALAPLLDGAVIDPVPTVPNPVGPGTVRVVVVLIGCGQPAGALVVGSRRAAFPSEEDRLFLTLGANQAAAVLQRLHAEVALRESEQRFRTFVDHAADAFFLHEEGTARVLDVNRQACESLGYTRDELIGMTPSDFDPDLTPALFEDRVSKLIAGETIAFESRHRRKDATIFPVEIRGKPFWEGGRRFSVALARDITERKRLEAELRQANARLDLAIRGSNVGIWEVDMPDGDFAKGVWNWINVWEQVGLEPPSDRSPFAIWLDAVHPHDKDRVLGTVQSYLNGETKDYEVEYRARHKDGTYRWMLTRGTAIRDQAGRPIRLVGSRVDITELKRVEEAERRAKEAAEAASRAKSEFLANVSHEIRTPMNAILGMTELAIETPVSDEQRQYLAIVKSSADALLSVINDLLDFSKIEAGKFELDDAVFSLRGVLGETLRALALRAHKKGLELVCQIQPDLPDALIGDAGRLRQILLNLVGNAIKFTEEGEVVIRIEAGPTGAGTEPDSPEDTSGPSQMLRFSVSDTGIGIPADRQQKIFQAFEQEDNSTTRRYGGTGLGLSIATRLVALMRGAIGVESEPGRGSTFHFTARFGLGADQPVPPMVPPLVELQGLRVLVVDDNATNRQILEGWLRGWRTEATVVAGGLEALDALWRASASGRPFSLVVLDARMPGVDGPALAERILQSPELSPTRIILLTSDDLHGEVARFRELGIAAYAMKPVQQEELLEIIYRVLSRPAPIGAGTDGSPRPDIADELHLGPALSAASAARPRILLAEDNDFNRQFIGQLLRRRGHEVVVARDGRKALEALDRSSFDLMLLDIQMPALDGFQVIELLRLREQTAGGHLPVVALTAHAMSEDRERCLQAGMDDYLSKPIRSAELFAAIDRVLAGRPASTPPPVSSPEPGILVDSVTLLAACDDDPALLDQLIRIFQNSIRGSLARVQEAIARQDPAQLREAAHQMRGLVSMFSPEAAQAAARLEAMGAGGEFGDAASTLATLADMIERLGPLLENLLIDELRRRSGRSLV